MKRKAKKAADYFFTYLLLIVIAIICAGPFIWLLLSSLRTGANIYNLHFSISDFSFSNYTGVMEYMNLPKYIWNTVIITFGGIIIDVVFSSLCAYPLATMEFKGKNIIFTILVGTMIIPAAAGMIINYLIITKMHLLNTMLGVILPSSTKAFSITSTGIPWHSKGTDRSCKIRWCRRTENLEKCYDSGNTSKCINNRYF